MNRRIQYILLVTGLMCFACRQAKNPYIPPTVTIPTAPSLLSQISAGETSVTVNWFDASDNEDGFKVQQLIDGNWTLFRQVGTHPGIGTYPNLLLDNLQRGATYHLRVIAFNASGNSDPSNAIDARPTGGALPPPPVNLQANAVSGTQVNVQWTDPGSLDSFVVERRLESGSWGRLGAVADGITQYEDHGAQAATRYYYRVGSKNSFATVWSTDSVLVETPNDQAPLAPDSLRASVEVGVRVVLTWRDRSPNEDGFTLQRGRFGEQLADIATLGAGVTTFEDHPTEEGVYNYRVRAFNGFGHSGWAELLNVDYQNCSRGLLPICVGNYWEYLVHDSAGPDYTIRRAVYRVETLGGLDFYLFAQYIPGGGDVDTLYYLRNSGGGSGGVQRIEHPAGNPPSTSLWFRYPANSGQFSIVGQDCVLVVSTNQTVQYGDSTYTNCYQYQTFTRGQVPAFSKRDITIEPLTLGIVQEVDRSSSSTVIARRDLTFAFVR